jgi:hypothetical protein
MRPGKLNADCLRHLPAPRLWLGVLLACVVALLTAGALMLTRTGDNPITATATPEPDCDLQRQPCSASFPDGTSVTLSFAPRPIRPVTRFDLQVTLEGLSPQEVLVDFAGDGMDMGFNRPRLVATGNGEFQTSAMLSVCTLDRMYWRATVLLTDERGTLMAPFRFETVQ